jgi:hypothetical protein
MRSNERKLYERIIAMQEDEITTLRLQLGLSKLPATPKTEEKLIPIRMEQGAFGHPKEEEIEDLEWLIETGAINMEEFEAKLKELGFDNTKIDLEKLTD